MVRLENVLQIYLQGVLKMDWRCLEEVFARHSWTRFEDILKIYWQHGLKMSCRRLEDVLKTSWTRFCSTLWRHLTQTNILVLIKTSWRRLEDLWLRQIYSPWSRHLEDIFWRRRRKTSSWHLYQDEYLLGSLLVGRTSKITWTIKASFTIGLWLMKSLKSTL